MPQDVTVCNRLISTQVAKILLIGSHMRVKAVFSTIGPLRPDDYWHVNYATNKTKLKFSEIMTLFTYLVIAAGPLRLRNDGGKGVGKVLKE